MHQKLPKAYSHRDCEMSPMLWKSWEHGFYHIEADVYCWLGNVFVAHDLQQLRPWNTLQRLYLEPFRTYLKTPSQTDAKLWLFVDIKTPAENSYLILDKLLATYRDIVTHYQADSINEKPITIVISGNRLSYSDMKQRNRYAVLDGRLEDLGKHTNPRVMPFISDNWAKHFRWQGEGAMPADEQKKLIHIINTAHQSGQKVRFWGTPDKPGKARENLWQTLLEHGIDLINTDDIAGLKNFFKER